jgi:ribosomal protection tetracycline resistance protein
MRTLNLGILAHVDAGKTTLSERLLFATGAIDHVGSVDAGTTQTDSLELERERGITIRSAVASFLVGNLAVNLVDTPGHPDFIAEVERVLADDRLAGHRPQRLPARSRRQRLRPHHAGPL